MSENNRPSENEPEQPERRRKSRAKKQWRDAQCLINNGVLTISSAPCPPEMETLTMDSHGVMDLSLI
jgi:hypothetical protein